MPNRHPSFLTEPGLVFIRLSSSFESTNSTTNSTASFDTDVFRVLYSVPSNILVKTVHEMRVLHKTFCLFLNELLLFSYGH